MALNRISAGRLRLEGDLTIYEAAALKTPLLAALEEEPTLEIDLSGVEELDTAGLQLLLLLKFEAQAGNRHVRFIQHSTAVREVLDLCDLAALFGDPIVIGRHNVATEAV
ncbi:phospholipid transport system transporter-binding protein [Gammaproteobacteria bacterium]